METPAILKILIVFLSVLALNRLKLPLGLALIAGGGLMELWADKSFTMLGADFIIAAFKPEVWLLMLNIALIIEFGHFMAAERNAQAIINAARRLGGRHGHALSLILVPAAIGLVPMPGGALFSAPLIDRAVKNIPRPPEWKVAVNYWFRHVLEYWWPLYPVVIIALSIFTMETWKFMAAQVPFTFVSVGAGYIFLLRGQSHFLTEKDPPVKSSPSLLRVLLPITIIVLATLLLPGLFRHLLPNSGSAVWKLLAMLTGLIAGLILISRDNGRQNTGNRLFAYLFSRKTANILFILAGVMIFKDLLEASELLPAAGRELANSQVPIELIIAILPFLAGLVTGIAVGFAGTAFPIVVGFLNLGISGTTPLAALVLAFTMGYAGMMLSPVHLCFVLTREYFSASFAGSLRYLLPCMLTVTFFGIGMHLVLKLMGW